MESIGDSIVCVADEEIVKIHVHTNDPGLAIQKALTYGSLTRMKIDNMREEHHERVIKNASEMAKQQKQEEKKVEFKENGFISVSVGDGLTDLFHELGVDEVRIFLVRLRKFLRKTSIFCQITVILFWRHSRQRI